MCIERERGQAVTWNVSRSVNIIRSVAVMLRSHRSPHDVVYVSDGVASEEDVPQGDRVATAWQSMTWELAHADTLLPASFLITELHMRNRHL